MLKVVITAPRAHLPLLVAEEAGHRLSSLLETLLAHGNELLYQ
ncbi:hypothetical protein [Streptomyces sp. NPDC126499]